MSRLHRASVIGATTSVLLAAAIALPAAPVAAAPKISFEVAIGNPCIDGTGPAKKDIRVTLKTPGGQLRGTADETISSNGTFTACPVGDVLSALITGVNGGDVIIATVGSTVRRWAVPRMTASVDRVTNVVSGRAPAGASVDVAIPIPVTGGVSPNPAMKVVADAMGDYRADFTGMTDIVGGEPVMVTAAFGSDRVEIDTYAPYLTFSTGSNLVQGIAASDASIQITLRAADGTLRAQVQTQPILLGLFFARFVDANGNAVYPHRGDWVTSSIASDAFLKVPDWRLAGNKTTEMVTGRCMPRSAYTVAISGAGSSGYQDEARKDGTTAADGSFKWNLLGLWNVKKGDSLTLVCTYKSGDAFSVAAVVQ